ncbi:MAG: PBP1A family penicillin-binding protein [Parcubacteria group bacterium]|nr:PBP1A family penicillin-binding protein [Parcubacteria group bacterium]
MANRHNRTRNLTLFSAAVGLFFTGALFLWAATLSLPDLATVQERKLSESTKIYDRTGEVLLYDVYRDKQRTLVPLDQISRHLKNATVAIEDAEFYHHRGIKPTAILRALFVNIGSFGFEQGGSTITQQVVKNSILTNEKTIARKLKEWILALKLERAASKDKILELYLNEVPYGGSIYGAEEASRTFFDKGAADISLAEAAYLAALPQAPTFYSPFGNNTEKLEERKNLVLEKMREYDFITDEELASARTENVSFQPQSTLGIRAPHFVFYVLGQLEKKYGRDAVETGGLRVVTTLDYALQEKAEDIVRRYAEENTKNFDASNAGLIAIEPATGQILVMVGSKYYFAEDIDGNFNVTIQPNRQPGSAFKPFVYATAFMKGYTPETVVFDLKTQFNTRCDADGKPLFPSVKEDECYMPGNYDEVFRGPITFREALAQSINVPAVKVLYLAGLRDSLTTARRMGITSLNDPDRYGLTLVLGGGEVSVLELTSAYSVFANEGERNAPQTILRVEQTNGTLLERFIPAPQRAIPKEIAQTVTDILADNNARTPSFGAYSPLYFPGKDVAAKTGTTNDYRDAWIIGYTPNIAVGAWAGNNDNSPMAKKIAGFIVAPLWHSFMEEALARTPDAHFVPPDQPPDENIKPVLRGVWQGNTSYSIDSVSGNLATVYTPDETKTEKFVVDVHTILRWVDRANPRGAVPDHPENDPQFALWEKPVREWVASKNIREGAPQNVPTAYDTVHSPDFAPKIKIVGVDASRLYEPNERVVFRVESAGKFPLARADVFVNNAYVGSINKSPFVFSFAIPDRAAKNNPNTLRVVGYDTVKNKGEASVSFLAN